MSVYLHVGWSNDGLSSTEVIAWPSSTLPVVRSKWGGDWGVMWEGHGQNEEGGQHMPYPKHSSGMPPAPEKSTSEIELEGPITSPGTIRKENLLWLHLMPLPSPFTFLQWGIRYRLKFGSQSQHSLSSTKVPSWDSASQIIRCCTATWGCNCLVSQ